MRRILNGLRGGLTFETTFPLSQGEEDFWSFVDNSFLYPMVGAIVGAILGGIAIPFSYLPEFIAAGTFLVVLYLICGILHTDGLADFADGLVTGGTHSERRSVMKDEKTGAAGLVSIFATNILLFSGLVELFSIDSFYQIFLIILTAEVLSKLGMHSVLFFGTSAHEGMASTFIDRMTRPDWVGGFLISFAFSALFMDPFVALPLIAVFLIVLGMVKLGDRVIGGINGDIAGAAGEIVRPIAIILFVLIDKVDVLALI
ncbi:adenosylcobinamide-GDP ribazoletransferase [Candidatus Bipolaricaulota bacterium]|nr:adenosylcobinamide-GDP ribazoletransferase [Candidatus Bipolaricaulota bacterium]